MEQLGVLYYNLKHINRIDDISLILYIPEGIAALLENSSIMKLRVSHFSANPS